MIKIHFEIAIRAGIYTVGFNSVSDMRKRYDYLTAMEQETERWNKTDMGELRQRNRAEYTAIAKYLGKL